MKDLLNNKNKKKFEFEKTEVRCKFCNKLFFKAYECNVEIKCSSCKQLQNIKIITSKSLYLTYIN